IQHAVEELGSARQRLLRPGGDTAPPVRPRTDLPGGAAPAPEDLQSVALKLQAPASPDPLLEGLQELLPVLQAQLGHPNVQVRLGAIEVLETLGDLAVPAAPALIRTLRDPNRFVRWAAA